jgi:hypothetical protein
MRVLAAALAVLVPIAASPPAMATEEPAYTLVEQDGPFELRQYAPYCVAETVVSADFESAGNEAFGRLVRYIGGNNRARGKIAMTAPVTQERGQKIAMTAPVAQEAAGDAFRVAFVMPAGSTLETLPEPADPRIELKQVPGRLIAAWRYSGRWTEDRFRDNERRLREELVRRGLAAAGEPIIARYNAPFVPWPLRRNEVMIPVRRSTAHCGTGVSP